MRERIIVILYKIALLFSYMADDLRSQEIYNKEYHIFVFGRDGWFC